MMDLNKIAEWAGFRFVNYCRWLYPDGTYHKELPNFPEDETACFKWLVPKLTYISLHYDKNLGYLVCVDNGQGVATVEAETPALALCLAIEKLIK